MHTLTSLSDSRNLLEGKKNTKIIENCWRTHFANPCTSCWIYFISNFLMFYQHILFARSLADHDDTLHFVCSNDRQRCVCIYVYVFVWLTLSLDKYNDIHVWYYPNIYYSRKLSSILCTLLTCFCSISIILKKPFIFVTHISTVEFHPNE